MVDAGQAMEPPPDVPRTTLRQGVWRVVRRTLSNSWDDDLFSQSAQAAFWQTLSLPPLLLALLGSLGFVGRWLGPDTATSVEQTIVAGTRQVFTAEVVDQIIAPTATSILTSGRADIVSVGFVVSLWAGSSAIAALVGSITVAHKQKLVRHPVWQRLFSLLLYLLALVVAVVTLPVIALGPDLLTALLPQAWQAAVTGVIAAFYYPVVGVVLVLLLATLYYLALPHALPWHRLLPGAVLAGVVFVTAATGLRIYLTVITSTGYTYGALATPIAFLLFCYLLGISIIAGAELNNAVDEVWPARPTRRQRRSKRLLAMSRLGSRLVHPSDPDPGEG
jgi:membrane protein